MNGMKGKENMKIITHATFQSRIMKIRLEALTCSDKIFCVSEASREENVISILYHAEAILQSTKNITYTLA